MKFSIVITTYNRVSFLMRAVESALKQTVPCEVIVIDDCSSDETEQYLCSLGSKIIYHRNTSNLGHAECVNTGVHLAQGDWIKLIDDDDYISENCIEKMMQSLILSPNSVICSCGAIQVDQKGKALSQTGRRGPGYAFSVSQSDIHYAMLLDQAPLGTPVQVAFNKTAFSLSGGWNSLLNYNSDDIDSWTRITKFGDAVFINECLAYRTMWPGGLNLQLDFQKRFEASLQLKKTIFHLVNAKYQPILPSFQDIESYIQLNWVFVALKNKSWQEGLKLLFPAVLRLKAWHLLAQAVQARYKPKDRQNYFKVILQE